MLKLIGMRLAGQVSHMEERNHTCEVWTGKINKKYLGIDGMLLLKYTGENVLDRAMNMWFSDNVQILGNFLCASEAPLSIRIGYFFN
jgi:hypothetical protein